MYLHSVWSVLVIFSWLIQNYLSFNHKIQQLSIHHTINKFWWIFLVDLQNNLTMLKWNLKKYVSFTNSFIPYSMKCYWNHTLSFLSNGTWWNREDMYLLNLYWSYLFVFFLLSDSDKHVIKVESPGREGEGEHRRRHRDRKKKDEDQSIFALVDDNKKTR